MGGELRAEPGAASLPQSAALPPVFSVYALQDAGTAKSPGAPLDRVQIVKISLAGGELHEKVFDVARSDAGDDLDPATCAAPKSGSSSLCAVWRDSEYDRSASALYYARVIEKPTCRWTGHLCAEARVDCSRPGTIPQGLAFCCDEGVAKTVRERAITSPIWVPAAG